MKLVPVLAALLVVSACESVPAQSSSRTDSYRGVSALVIDHEVGSISITAGGTVTVARTIRQAKGKPATEHISQDGSTLHVGADCPPSFGAGVCTVDYRITAPADVTVKVKAAGNAVTADGLTTVDITTDSGPITLRNAAEVHATTQAGRLSIQQSAPGRIDARSDSGSMSLRPGPGHDPVTATATSGKITVTLPADGTFHVTGRSTAGHIDVGVHQSASGRPLTLTTDSGDITVK